MKKYLWTNGLAYFVRASVTKEKGDNDLGRRTAPPWTPPSPTTRGPSRSKCSRFVLKLMNVLEQSIDTPIGKYYLLYLISLANQKIN